MTRDRELTLKISGQIESMRRYKESHNLEKLLALVEQRLGTHHLLVVILGRRKRTCHSFSGDHWKALLYPTNTSTKSNYYYLMCS